MRKRMISKKFVSSLLAFAMAISVANPVLGPVASKAEEIETQEMVISDETQLDETQVALAAALEDSYAKMSFYDMWEDGTIQVSDGVNAEKYTEIQNVSDEDEDEDEEESQQIVSDALLLTAGAEEVGDARISFSRTFDFGDKIVDRLAVNGLAKRASVTKLQICVGQDTEPIAAITLPNQTKADVWTKNKELVVDLSALGLTGVCDVHFQFTASKASDGAEEELQVLLRSMQFVPESIPVVTLDIDESKGSIANMNKDPYHNTECYGTMSIRVPDSYENPFGEAFTGGTYEMDYIRGRGNSTWQDTKKKPYHVKLDKGADLFHMGKSKHWLLLANYYDCSLVRNRMTYWLGQELGFEYTPRCINVDVVMNGECLGNYLLCEQIRVDKNRLDIYDLETAFEEAEDPDQVDVSGGYLVGYMPYGDEKGYGFVSPHEQSFYVNIPESSYDKPLSVRMDYPEEEDNSVYRRANEYIESYVAQLEEAIYSDGFKTKDGVSYTELMDVDSAVAYYMVQEFSQNGDFCVTPSTSFYKKADVKDDDGNVITRGKIYWGPLWDFDAVAWGNTLLGSCAEGEELIADFECQISWFRRLMEDPVFAAKVRDFWKERMKPAMEEVVRDGGLLDQYEEELGVSANINYDKWKDSKDKGPAAEMRCLKSWISRRIQWVDENIDSILPKPVKIIFKDGEKTLLEANGTVGKEIHFFPEDPMANGKFFVGWFCNYTYEEDGETYSGEFLVDEDYTIDLAALNAQNELILEARYENKSEIVSVDQIIFEGKGYCTYYVRNDPGSFTIHYTALPKNAEITKLKWKSSNEKVAKVLEDGTVTARGFGETIITATTPTGKDYSVPVLVLSQDEFEAYQENGLEIDKEELELTKGQSHKLYIGTPPEYVSCQDLYDTTYRWLSTNESVAVVDTYGYVTAVGPGQTTIIAIDNAAEQVFRCKVTVKDKAKNPSCKVGTKFKSGNLRYQITACKGSNLQVQVIGKVKSAKTITIPATVTYAKKKFKVTSLKASVFSKDKKITKLTIGKNVKKIGSKAFYKCKNLKTIKISSKVLKSVGKQAFRGISKKVKISAPKGMKKKYKKLMGH